MQPTNLKRTIEKTLKKKFLHETKGRKLFKVKEMYFIVMRNEKIPPSKDQTVALCIDTMKRKKQALVFCSSKRGAESQAEKVSKEWNKETSQELTILSNKILKAVNNPTKQCRRLALCILKGVAFHHAGLTSIQRELVEDAFRDGLMLVICSTPTLCISGDTKIWHGIDETSVKNAKQKQKTRTLITNKLETIKSIKIERIQNNSKLKEITSVSNFKIKVTPKHRMYVKRENKKLILSAKNIQVTDKIATIGKINAVETKNYLVEDFVKENDCPRKNKLFDKKQGYLIGAMLGDGYSGAEITLKKIKYKGSPSIVGIDEEIFEKIIEASKELNIPQRKTKNTNGTPEIILGKHKWFREYLLRCGVEKREKKHISHKLMKLPKKIIKELLQGLFDTDGHVEKRGNIGFSNISEQLIQQIQKQLLRFGIISRIRKRKKGPMKIYDKEYATVPIYELLITQKESILLFKENVGFTIQRKQKELEKIVKKINSNILYSQCTQCNYKLYKDLFSGRTKEQKIWGIQKYKIIKTLFKKEELPSRRLKKILLFEPRKKEKRLNHHYELIKKVKGNKLDAKDWLWSLNSIGSHLAKKLFEEGNPFEEFFTLENCPLCKSKLEIIKKKGWRNQDIDGDIFWDKIKSIKTISCEKTVYDVVLPNNPTNSHLFVANGFLVHNSAGLDLPAFRAIIRDTKRFGARGMTSIPVLEYEQMSGRAGRPGKEEYGEAIIIAGKEQDVPKHFAQYINGEIEDIYSKLAVEPVLRTYILSLVATGIINTRKELMDFFDKTFYAKQFGDLYKLHASLDKMSIALQEWGFLEDEQSEEQKQEKKAKKKNLFVNAVDLLKEEKKQEKLEATILGKRVSEIYLDPLTANQILEGLSKIMSKPKDKTDHEQTFNIVHLLTCSLELRPLIRTKVKNAKEIEAKKEEIELLFNEEEYYSKYQDNFDDSIKTTLFLLDWMSEYGEEKLLEKYDIRPGEINAKLQRMNWLLYSAEEIARINQYQPIIKILKHIKERIKYGVKSELLTLLRFKGIGRTRARKLFRAGIKTIQDVKKTNIETLASIVGPKLAKSLHEETGIRVEQEPTNKEKGLRDQEEETKHKQDRKSVV